MKRATKWGACLLVLGLSACTSGRHSPVGFRLPENGDIDRGRAAFVELDCHACHRVVGDDSLPQPRADAAVVVLGGEVQEVRTDGYLVTSIIHPSHKLGPYPRGEVTVDGESRMPDYARSMTVRQLIDVVAYLQSHYRVVPPPYMHP